MNEPLQAITLAEMFLRRVDIDPDRSAFHIKRDGAYHALTWRQVSDDVCRVAAALRQLGVCSGDRVIQVSDNRYEWIVVDLAIQLVAAVHVPVHATLSGQQIAWQIVDSEARLVVLSCDEQAGKLQDHAEEFPAALELLSFERCTATIGNATIPTIEDAVATISPSDAKDVRDTALIEGDSDALATILYTSGTTGEPKGVMLTQRNLVSNAVATCSAFQMDRTDVRLGFLPLSHVFARTCDLYTWIARGSQLALADSRESVLADCALLKPTVLTGVPYFFEKVYRRLTEDDVAVDDGILRSALGGNIRVCASGGAALPDHVCQFFHDNGVPLLQGYGLTESSPVITLSTRSAWRPGTVGRTLPGVEVSIAEDGEILTRGPHVMAGYWKNPAATAEVIRDGWLHTGDIGALDADDFLQITGRKKELIVTSGGKNIAPTYLESRLTEDALILQALVVGDGRKFLTALIVPDPDRLKAEIASRSIAVYSAAAALGHPDVQSLYADRIRERLADLSHFEQIGRFTLMDRGFTIESGEMTPKLSLRRKVIEANCAELIEGMYE